MSKAQYDVRMELAKLAELTIVVEILSEASIWAETQGEKLWEPEQLPPFMKESIEHNEVYLAYLKVEENTTNTKDNSFASNSSMEPVGTVTIQWSDVLGFWRDKPVEAGYIYKLAVRRKFAGLGVGAKIVSLAEKIIKSKGKQYARLDTSAPNKGLNAYYVNLGYSFSGIVPMPPDPCCKNLKDLSLYEKKL